MPDFAQSIAHAAQEVEKGTHLGQCGGRVGVARQGMIRRIQLRQERARLARLFHKVLDGVRCLQRQASDKRNLPLSWESVILHAFISGAREKSMPCMDCLVLWRCLPPRVSLNEHGADKPDIFLD